MGEGQRENHADSTLREEPNGGPHPMTLRS